MSIKPRPHSGALTTGDEPRPSTPPLRALPPLELIRSFVAVSRAMSITLAARELCVTQSAVSRQIRALEDFLQCALFIRGHRRIELTNEGSRLFRASDAWLEQLADTVAALRPPSTHTAVTVTATVGVSSLWLLPRIGEFQAAHPDVELRVVTSNRVLDLEREHIDLAIRYVADADAPVGATRLFGDEVMPVAHASLRIAALEEPGTLQRHVLLELDDPSHPRLQWAYWLEAAQLGRARPVRIVRFNQYDQLIQAALAGQGVALGRLALVDSLLRAGRLKRATRLPPMAIGYAYWMLSSRRPLSDRAVAVRGWIARAAAAGTRVGRSRANFR